MSLAVGRFTLLLACSVFMILLHACSCCLSELEIINHPRVSLASLLGEEQTLSRTKRGGGWGFPSKTVGAELRTIPVEWWYNWGNYIPDTDAANFTQVLAGAGIAARPGSCDPCSPPPTRSGLNVLAGFRRGFCANDLWQLLWS